MAKRSSVKARKSPKRKAASRPDSKKVEHDKRPSLTRGQKSESAQVAANNAAENAGHKAKPHPDWMTRLTAGLLIVGFMTVYIIAGQSKLMRQSVEQVELVISATREANRITSDGQRPWVSIDVTAASNYVVEKNGGVNFEINLIVKNYGRTPALKLTKTVRMIAGDIYLDPIEAQKFLCDSPKGDFWTPFINANSTNIFPDQSAMEKISVGFTADETEKASLIVKSTPVAPMIIGCVDYFSSVNRSSHRTDFVIVLTESSGVLPGANNLMGGGLLYLPKGTVVPQDKVGLYIWTVNAN